MSISVNIEKQLGDFHLKVAFEAGAETLALLGASGCGKSMTLKCIAGIERPDRGRIVVDDVVLFDSEQGINLSPQDRHIGLMFQNYALFPNMTVAQNVYMGAKREKRKEKRQEAVSRILRDFGLKDLADRYPYQLSGGQQQRVALARILVSDPKLLLLDEPFSALDSHLRFRMEQEVRAALRTFGKPVVLVSHDRDEVFRMAHKVAVLNNGAVEVCGTKQTVFAAPETKAAAMLTGCKNISAIERIDENRFRALDWGIVLSGNVPEGAAYVGIRMHHLRPGEGKNSFRCRVVEEIENPFSYTLLLRPIDRESAVPLGWETDKSSWNDMRSSELQISLPSEALLFLTG